MASASSDNALASAVASMNTANSSKKAGGDGEVRKIEVNVKMNGRELNNFIVKDTAIQR